MKGRVKWDGKISGMVIDWGVLVEKPLNGGYVIEAFASADAIIDSSLHSLLRQVFSSFESQSLINELESVKEETKFFGAGVLRILENVGIVDKKILGNKIRDFKGKRNKVSHNTYGEYSLVRMLDFDTQDKLDVAVEQASRKILGKALDIFLELTKIGTELAKELGGMNQNDKNNWLIGKKQS